MYLKHTLESENGFEISWKAGDKAKKVEGATEPEGERERKREGKIQYNIFMAGEGGLAELRRSTVRTMSPVCPPGHSVCRYFLGLNCCEMQTSFSRFWSDVGCISNCREAKQSSGLML